MKVKVIVAPWSIHTSVSYHIFIDLAQSVKELNTTNIHSTALHLTMLLCSNLPATYHFFSNSESV